MKLANSALGPVEIGVLAQVPIYGNRKQVIVNVDQCIVFRDETNGIARMLLALDSPEGYRYLNITDPDKIAQLRKGAKRLKANSVHPALTKLLDRAPTQTH